MLHLVALLHIFKFCAKLHKQNYCKATRQLSLLNLTKNWKRHLAPFSNIYPQIIEEIYKQLLFIGGP